MGPRLLALDTSTEVLAVGLTDGQQLWRHVETGGALASSRMIGSVLALLDAAGLPAQALDAVAFGAGPGAFTGLRSACAVAQGLAFGLQRPVIAVDSLMIVAEDARAQLGAAAGPVWVAMDARMDEIYAGRYHWQADGWQVLDAPALWAWPALAQRWIDEPPACVAGSALQAFGERLPAAAAARVDAERDRAGAMLAVARALWDRGCAVPASQALPIYLRDKVALTTAEREAAAARRDGAGS
jgi:tRNA threonylcarbamoyladenosine biosynthesis protein TsaB